MRAAAVAVLLGVGLVLAGGVAFAAPVETPPVVPAPVETPPVVTPPAATPHKKHFWEKHIETPTKTVPKVQPTQAATVPPPPVSVPPQPPPPPPQELPPPDAPAASDAPAEAVAPPAVQPPAEPAPSPAASPRPPSNTPTPPAAPLLSPAVVVQLQVAFFALTALFGGEAMLRSMGGLTVPAPVAGALIPQAEGMLLAVGVGGDRGHGRGSVARASVDSLKDVAADGGIGDRSRSWQWPGTTQIDRAMRALPVRLAPYSPLLARIAVDGSSLRAMLGTLQMFLPVAGVALGAAALHDTGGMPTPPGLGLLTAVAVIGVLDALAGFLAVTVFAAGAAIAGNLGSGAEIRTMLGLAVIWFAVPLIAGAARPLRRLAAQSTADWRAWIGDLAIASLIGAWAIQKMITALPALAGTALPIAPHATTVALIVLGACAIRIVFEGAAARWYPKRLAEVQSTSVPGPIPAQRIAAAGVRTALLLFVASAFLGVHWQLWVGGLLFLVPQVISVFEGHFPNSTRLYRVLPRGIVKLVIMLVVGFGIGILVLRAVANTADPALNSFVLLAIPGVIVSGIELFGRQGQSPEEGWGRWLVGAGFLATAIWLVLFALA